MYIRELIRKRPELLPEKDGIIATCGLITDCFNSGNRLYLCGNGGSAADSEHISGELMKGFLMRRPLDDALIRQIDAIAGEKLGARLQRGLPAIALTGHISLMTVVINDLGGDLVYAQQLMAFGAPRDVLLGLSTSGNAENIVKAFTVAKALGISTVALTGGKAAGLRSWPILSSMRRRTARRLYRSITCASIMPFVPRWSSPFSLCSCGP